MIWLLVKLAIHLRIFRVSSLEKKSLNKKETFDLRKSSRMMTCNLTLKPHLEELRILKTSANHLKKLILQTILSLLPKFGQKHLIINLMFSNQEFSSIIVIWDYNTFINTNNKLKTLKHKEFPKFNLLIKNFRTILSENKKPKADLQFQWHLLTGQQHYYINFTSKSVSLIIFESILDGESISNREKFMQLISIKDDLWEEYSKNGLKQLIKNTERNFWTSETDTRNHKCGPFFTQRTWESIILNFILLN